MIFKINNIIAIAIIFSIKLTYIHLEEANALSSNSSDIATTNSDQQTFDELTEVINNFHENNKSSLLNPIEFDNENSFIYTESRSESIYDDLKNIMSEFQADNVKCEQILKQN